VIEDLHWAGAGTISLLEHLARRLVEDRVLIVATYREEETLRSHPLREMRRRMQKEGRIVKISLGPLSFDDVREILEGAAATSDASLAGRFFAATEGHPLFLSELVREIAAGAPAPDDDELDVANLPGSVTAAIDVRLGRLSDAARSLVESAAVVGRGFDIALLSESSALGQRKIAEAIAELLEGNIVRESGARGSSYNFTHQLFQTRAYERIPHALRAERHLRVARAIEELYPDRHLELSSELAHHFEEAGESDRAAACYLLAARRALDLYANEDAVAQATSGLALGPTLGTLVVELLLTREEGFGRLGRRYEQADDLDRLEALAGKDVSDEMACEALHRRIAFARATSDRERERAAIAQLAERAVSARWQARAQLARGSHLLAAGSFAEAGPILEETLRRFDELQDTTGIVDAALEIVRLYRSERNYDGIRAMFARAEECLDDRPQTRFVRAKLLVQQITVEMMAQRYRAMSPLAEKLLELSVSIGYVEGEALAYRSLGGAAAWQLNVVRARDFLERAARMFEKIGNRRESYSVLAEVGIMSVFIGRFQDAETAFMQALAAASDLEYGFGVATCYVNLAACHNRSGEFERSRAASLKALELWKALGTEAALAPTLFNLGVAQRGCGDDELALETLSRAAALLGPETGEQLSAEVLSQLALSQLRMGYRQACQETLERLLPLLDAGSAAFDGMPEIYTAAIDVLRGLGRPDEAQALASRGHAVMQKHLRAIPDDESRRAFLNVAAHRALLEGGSGDGEGRFSDSAFLESK
jgi:tetratricopeptide (TPR) repeat protein